ncbi:MAG TPA: N-acetylornithine carbamoyltransferase [Chitinophagaceae bacterium]|nr:N-acetylornithine carbamoyltransferase [Chitinophagaceae bacterium]
MKNFLSVKDAGNIEDLVSSAIDFRNHPLSQPDLGKSKRLGLIFLNPSLRTRLSTQVAAQNLGMEALVFNASQDGWSLEFEEGAIMNGTSVEHVKDAAPILGRYFDILGLRTFPSLKNRAEDYAENVMKQFVKYSGIPIISLESATVHPLQSLTDIITITDHLPVKNKAKSKVVLTWAPHVKPLPQCVANSFSEWINAWGKCDFTIAHPQGYELDKEFTKDATITSDQAEALQNADFVYVKNWSSYKDYGKTEKDGSSWMLTNKKLSLTNNAKVMHCLPVRRNVELSDEVLDSPNSIVTEQAANRVWAAQAVLANILKDIP